MKNSANDFKNVVLDCEKSGKDFITQITQFAKAEYSPDFEFTLIHYTAFLKRMGFDLNISESDKQKEVVFINKDTKDSIRFKITKNNTASSTTTTSHYANQDQRTDTTVWRVSQLKCEPENVLAPTISQLNMQPVSQPSPHISQSIFTAQKSPQANPAEDEQSQWFESLFNDDADQNKRKDSDPKIHGSN